MKPILIISRFFNRKVLDFLSVLDLRNLERVYCIDNKEIWVSSKIIVVNDIKLIEKKKNKYFFLPVDEQDFTYYEEYLNKYSRLNIKLIGPIKYNNFISKSKFYDFAKNSLKLAPSYHEYDHADTKYVVKPNEGSGSRGIFQISRADIKKFSTKNYFIQKLIKSSQEPYGYCGFVNNKGKIISYSHKRLVTQKQFGGVSLISVKTTSPKKLVSECNKFLISNNYHGFFMFEYMIDELGNYFIIEFNPRIWGSFKIGVKDIKIDNYQELRLRLNKEKTMFLFINGLFKNFSSFFWVLIKNLFTHQLIISPSIKYISFWKGVYDRKKTN